MDMRAIIGVLVFLGIIDSCCAGVIQNKLDYIPTEQTKGGTVVDAEKSSSVIVDANSLPP
jgi:hypothetical protein